MGDKSHQGYVNCLRWSHNNNFEILSGSSNGEVFWWDIRKMNEAPCQFKIEFIETDNKGLTLGTAVDNLNTDSTDFRIDNKYACTAVEFDQISSKHIRIGTGDGRVIYANKNGNKMEKTFEIKCHEASLSTVAQNWASYKCILTVDSCEIKVWGEDIKLDPIFSVSSIENEYACGAWSLTRLVCYRIHTF